MSRFVLILALAGCGRLGVSAESAGDAQDAPGASGDAMLGAADPLLLGCALYMKMDEAAWSGAPGEVIDSCGGHNGTSASTAAIINDPVRGRVGSFPDPLSCVNVADTPSLRPTTALTISAWIHRDTTDPSGAYGITTKRIDYLNDSTFALYVDSGGLVFADIDTENDRASGTSSLPMGEWHQVTLVYDGSLPETTRVHFYRDGQPDGTIAETSTSISQFTGGLTVGCMQLPSQPADLQSTHGELDDLVIWFRPLASAEVSTWYQRTMR